MAACPRTHSFPWLIGCAGLPSSFFARPILMSPVCPLRTTSASPCMIRTSTPQPDGHNGQMLGFQVAIPGMISSSGTKRMSWFSGLPQLASVALALVAAVTFINWRRSIVLWFSVVTSEAIVRSFAFLMAGDAEAHRMIHHTPGDRHLRDVSMACGALHFRADVRRVVETD